MKQTNQKIMHGLVVGVMACSLAHGQSRAQSPSRLSVATNAGASESGGYSTGGERGGVVQVISDAEVQSELNLSSEQQPQVNDVLRGVKAMENELFEDFRRSRQEWSDNERAGRDQQTKKYEEAHQQLSRATEKILEQLTPAQRTRLQMFCRQAQADERGFHARMAPGQGYGRGGGGFGAGGGSFTGGGGGGG